MTNPRNQTRTRRHAGFVLTEVVIAAMVLVVVISVLTQLVFRGGRLQRDNRHHQAAVEELTNQIDRLTALDEAPRAAALEGLACSPAARAALPSPELTAEVLDDADGRRLVLRLAWDRFGARKPLTLVGWLPPIDGGAESNPAEGPST